MMRWLRRLIWLALLAAIGYGAFKALSRGQSQSGNAPQWSPAPADRAGNSAKSAAASGDAPSSPRPTTTDSDSSAPRWKISTNGECPKGYPIKANDSSRIFHVPGGRFYERTAADRCYANADDAVADGYRAAKA
ncbi:MAG TPA: hypothetical protein VH761_17825 [Ilumatobacteraceae bacterium]|jgi:hypothetical protein